MENEKMQVNFAPGVTEATLRVIELHEENELPVLEPDKARISRNNWKCLWISLEKNLWKRADQSETLLYSCWSGENDT